MKQYIEALNKYAQEQGADSGDAEGASLVELLYYCFCIHNALDTDEIRKIFRQMEEILQKLSLDDNNTLFNMACDLCEKYQHEAFCTGLLAGFRLCRELTEKM